MTKNQLVVADNLIVSLEYILRLDDGSEVDRSEVGSPLQFLQGQGYIIPGLERELYGMRQGESKQISVAAADGYGEFDPDDLEVVKRSIFPADMELSLGMDIPMRDAESDETYSATVTEVEGDNVTLDFNHPLAGETLLFDVTVAGLRSATSEELSHGHAH